MTNTREVTDVEALLWMGELAIVWADAEQTGGRYSLVELWATQEGAPPMHVHHKEDEGFYVLEGELTITVGDRSFKAGPGSFFLGPKDVPHKYTVDTGTARILMLFSPAGFEGFVRETSVPATSLVPPEPGSVDIDYEAIGNVSGDYGAEIVGE